MKHTFHKNLVFLFGAGISIGADLPNCAAITKQVLAGGPIPFRRQAESRGLGARYFPTCKRNLASRSDTQRCLQRVLLMLQDLKTHADLGLYPHRKANYEDLYYITAQVFDHLRGRRENPAITPFITDLSTRFESILAGTTKSRQDFNICPENAKQTHECTTLADLARECCSYIESTVTWLLMNSRKPAAYLSWLADAIKDPDFETVSLCTLNHDLLLEQSLKHYELSDYADGFGTADKVDSLRPWKPSTFSLGKRLSLVKLHGSLNWFLMQETTNTFENGVPIGCLDDHREARRKNWQALAMLLIGTSNKELHYSAPAFESMHHQFSQALWKSNLLIVCGYGFADGGINSRLVVWMLGSPARRMVVIDPFAAPHPRGASWNLRAHWETWEAQNRLICIRQRVEDRRYVNWPVIKKALGLVGCAS